MRQQNKAQYCASAVHRGQTASIHTFYPDQDGVPNDLKFQGHGTTKSLAMIPGMPRRNRCARFAYQVIVAECS